MTPFFKNYFYLLLNLGFFPPSLSLIVSSIIIKGEWSRMQQTSVSAGVVLRIRSRVEISKFSHSKPIRYTTRLVSCRHQVCSTVQLAFIFQQFSHTTWGNRSRKKKKVIMRSCFATHSPYIQYTPKG